jgi:hypothetical protein
MGKTPQEGQGLPRAVEPMMMMMMTSDTLKTRQAVTKIEARPCNHCCNIEAKSITCSEGVFIALIIQRAMLDMQCSILSTCSVRLYKIVLPTLRKGTNFGNVIEHKTSVFIFCANFPETFLMLMRNERDKIINIFWSARKVPVILVRFK